MSNSGVDHVTRFPASDPSKVEKFKVGYNSSGLAIDSQGNVWVTNRFGNGLLGMAHLVDMGVRLKFEGVALAFRLPDQDHVQAEGRRFGGSVTLLRPDGSPYPGSPFRGGGLPGPWAAAVDGNDNVWISNFADAEQSDRAAVRRPHRKLPARHEDRRPDLAARRLCRRRLADADRSSRSTRQAMSGR